jgi:Protein of unknown function (DUF3300)
MAPQPAAEQSFSQDELNALLAPIALYPDGLLSQVLMASTYPLEVVEADRFLKQNSGLQGEALDEALAQKKWDPSVQSLAAYPKVIAMMSDKLEWTEHLGDAFLEDQGRVMDTVQALRRRAQAAGNLKSTSQQTVVQDKETIIIEPTQTEVVYVPDYDYDWLLAYELAYESAYDYYGYGRYSGYGRYYGSVSVRYTSYHISGNHWGWEKADWRNRQFRMNAGNNRFWNQAGRTAPTSGSAWQHDPVHRQGVGYPTAAMRERFPGGNPAAGRLGEGGFPSASRGELPQGGPASAGPRAGGPSPMGAPQPPGGTSGPPGGMSGPPSGMPGGFPGGMPGGFPGGMPGGFPGGMPGPPPGPPHP